MNKDLGNRISTYSQASKLGTNINQWISKNTTRTFHYLLRNRSIIFIFYRTVLTSSVRVYIHKYLMLHQLFMENLTK